MQTQRVILDQLALAAEQIREGISSASRIGLILTDNAVELMLHFYAGMRFKDSPKSAVVQKVLGRHFNPKVNYALRETLLNRDEAELCRHAHRFRNEAYHLAMLHDDFVFELAWKYHEFACDAVPRFLIWAPDPIDDLLVDKVLRNLGADLKRATLNSEQTLRTIGTFLNGRRIGAPRRSLPDALSDSAAKRIEKLENELTLFSEGAAGTRRAFLRLHRIPEKRFGEWKSRAGRIRQQTTGTALASFHALTREFEKVETLLSLWNQFFKGQADRLKR